MSEKELKTLKHLVIVIAVVILSTKSKTTFLSSVKKVLKFYNLLEKFGTRKIISDFSAYHELKELN